MELIAGHQVTEANSVDNFIIDGHVRFFYGRDNNDLWKLLPELLYAEPLQSLKNAPVEEKKAFMAEHKIDFVDLIKVLDGVPREEAANYEDEFIDQYTDHPDAWFDVKGLIQSTPSIKAVYLTRKTFNTKVKNMRQQAKELKDFCSRSGIRCAGLITPSRMYRDMNHKRNKWRETLQGDLTEFTGI
ncbi:MAG: hypothetical protein E6Q44_12780 [Flavobacteriales bacterium]|nr:MAG: hypothetical protein E6Q44_12780 [Flavobacteriales bacterium]